MITLEVHFLKTLSEKSKGLLGATKGYAVYFTTRFGIHTFGMKFSIDVLILDSNNIVVKYVEKLAPNKLFFWNPRFDKIIELPSGEIQKQKIQCGDTIRLEFILVD